MRCVPMSQGGAWRGSPRSAISMISFLRMVKVRALAAASITAHLTTPGGSRSRPTPRRSPRRGPGDRPIVAKVLGGRLDLTVALALQELPLGVDAARDIDRQNQF